MAVRCINPYSVIEAKYSEGLDAIVSSFMGSPTVDDLVNAVYSYVVSAYSMSSVTGIQQQNMKTAIYGTINGYLNYNLLYNPQQMNFIQPLINGTLACGNPEDINQHILDMEEEITGSGLSSWEQMPLLNATAAGKAAYTYWANQINSAPASWTSYITSFTPPIVKFPYWVAATMQGALIGLNYLNTLKGNSFLDTLGAVTEAEGADVLFPLYGALAVCCGKVIFNYQQRSAGN